jgi:hypothetical protein
MSTNSIQGQDFGAVIHHTHVRRGFAFGIIIIAALLAFEIFNYSTTDYALADLLGNLRFMGVRWATILAIAFCGIDFAGIARLFTPEEGADEPGEVWYLFGAWLLAATMNAMLTWWGVSLAVLNHETLGSAVIDRTILLRVVPIFVAVLVWLIRVLIIGTFSVAGDRLFSQGDQQITARPRSYTQPVPTPSTRPVRALGNRPPIQRPAPTPSGAFRPAPKPTSQNSEPAPQPRQEPTYHPISMSGNDGKQNRGTIFASGAQNRQQSRYKNRR